MNDIFAKLKKLTHKSDGSFNRVSVIVAGAILFAVVPIIFVVVFLAYTTYDEIASEPQSRQNQIEMENEFRRIQPPPDATPTSNNLSSTRKTHHGVVGQQYRTNLSYPEIRAYYDSELGRLGWKFEREKNFTYRDKYSDGKMIFYSKGKFEAVIEYGGQYEQNEMGWTYGLDLSWGLDD